MGQEQHADGDPRLHERCDGATNSRVGSEINSSNFADLTNRRGRPWTSDGFRTSWGKLCAKAKIEGLTFHDLRGWDITRLSLAGASPQQIAAVTGHSLADVGAILDRHYLGDRPALAKAAIRKR